MRSAWMVGGMALLLVIPAQVSSQTRTAVLQLPEAEVRSGPSDAPEFYSTNRLRKGDRVEIVKQEPNGWLAIKPPPGSFSWVNMRFLKPLGKDRKTWTVESEGEAEVLYGSSLHKERPSVRSDYLKRGTLVRSVGQPYVPSDGGTWLPIEPPPSEVRYVRETAIAAEAAVAQNSPPPVAERASAGTQPWNNPSVALVSPPAVSPPANDPRWAEAEKAEKAGQIREAIELYNRLGREVANTDHELSMRSYNQAYALQRGNSSSVETRLRPAAAGSAPPGFAGVPGQVCCTPCGQGEYVCRGVLREAHQSLDYKRTFVVIDSWGRLVAYATPAGADLEKQLNRVVEVSGAACWRGDVRANYVRASRVTPLQ